MAIVSATDKEVIDFIHDLFEDPNRWIKGRAAQTPLGLCVSPKDPRAACFCLNGAVDRYSSDINQRLRIGKLISRFVPDAVNKSVVAFNDHRKTTVEDVRAVLKVASSALNFTE